VVFFSSRFSSFVGVEAKTKIRHECEKERNRNLLRLPSSWELSTLGDADADSLPRAGGRDARVVVPRKNIAREEWVLPTDLQSRLASVDQFQGIHERFVFVLPRSRFCLRAALASLLEFEDLAASQPFWSEFFGHS
jgi:hypothetical protein